MRTLTNDLIQNLIERTQKNIKAVDRFNQLSEEALNWRKTPDSWSVLECIEHLNRYGDFYIPEIKHRIVTTKHSNIAYFKSSWLGEYFAQSMLPKAHLNTMKTFKSMNPIGSHLTNNVLTTFLEQQQQLLDLLEQAKHVNLRKTKTGISISKWIKLRLGDTFRVIIYHNERHIIQAQNVINQLQ